MSRRRTLRPPARPEPGGRRDFLGRAPVAEFLAAARRRRRGPGRRPDRVAGAGQERPRRERGEQRSLAGEAFADGVAPAGPPPALLGSGRPGEAPVELIERIDLGDRHELGPPRIAGEPIG